MTTPAANPGKRPGANSASVSEPCMTAGAGSFHRSFGTARLASLGRVARIARQELHSLFRKPVIWTSLLLAALMAGWNFTSLIDALAHSRSPLRPAEAPVVQLLGPTVWLVGTCTVLMPLLMMNLAAEDRRRLAAAMPVAGAASCHEIVAGKFLAGWGALMVCLTPWLYFLVVLGLSGAVQPALDWGAALSGCLGLVVLGSTFTAIGVLSSAPQRNPLSAGAWTFAGMLGVVVFSVLPRVLAFRQVREPIVRASELAACWALQDEFSRGLIAPRAIVAQLSISVVLLALAVTVGTNRDDC